MSTELHFLTTIAPWLMAGIALGYGIGLLTTLWTGSGRNDR
jgi:hypothetical protein